MRPGVKEEDHALETLVDPYEAIANRMREETDLSMDGPLSGRNDGPQGSDGGDQHRACPGAVARML